MKKEKGRQKKKKEGRKSTGQKQKSIGRKENSDIIISVKFCEFGISWYGCEQDCTQVRDISSMRGIKYV